MIRVLVADPATWRDLMWITMDTLVGWLLALTPASLIAWGLFGVVMPALWHPIVATVYSRGHCSQRTSIDSRHAPVRDKNPQFSERGRVSPAHPQR